MQRDSFFIVTGSINVGKTELVRALSETAQFLHSSELAGKLIEEQISNGGKLIPWIDRYAFENELLRRRIAEYASIRPERVCFFDRGVPEAIAFLRSEAREVPAIFFSAARKYRYNRAVFFLPPWREIYRNMSTRPQTFLEAKRVGELLRDLY